MPYGESAQAFVLRSINYDAFKAPDEDKKVNLTTESDIRVRGTGRCRVKFDNQLEIESESTDIYSAGEIEISALGAIKLESTNASIKLDRNSVELMAGGTSINLSENGIQLSVGGSSINMSENNISLDSGNITTNPPVCKCGGI